MGSVEHNKSDQVRGLRVFASRTMIPTPIRFVSSIHEALRTHL